MEYNDYVCKTVDYEKIECDFHFVFAACSSAV